MIKAIDDQAAQGSIVWKYVLPTNYVAPQTTTSTDIVISCTWRTAIKLNPQDSVISVGQIVTLGRQLWIVVTLPRSISLAITVDQCWFSDRWTIVRVGTRAILR